MQSDINTFILQSVILQWNFSTFTIPKTIDKSHSGILPVEKRCKIPLHRTSYQKPLIQEIIVIIVV